MSTQSRLRGPERFTIQPVAPQRPSLARFLGAALALLVLLVGVPVALWALSGPPPIPDGLPTRSDLSEPLSIDAVLVVLRVVAWLAWLQFAVCTVVEVVSLARGGDLPRPVPLSGRSQALARALVGTLLVGTSLLGSTGAAQAAAPVSAPVVSTVGVDEGAGAAQQEAPTRAQADEAGRPAAPEQRMAHVPGVPATMTDVIGHKVAIVMPPKGHYHDNLWDIAERTMGDGRRWKEIYELNKNRVQPDGQQLVLGRLIQPGWVLIMPDDAQGVQRVRALADADPAPAGGGADASGEEGAETAAGVATADAGHLSLLASGGLLAAALLGALMAERRRRRGLVASDAADEAEADLRFGADTERSDRLDLALRSLAALCRTHRTELPQVYAARVSDDAIDLHLAPPVAEAPTPWSVHDDGARWQLATDAHVTPESGPAPYPALVCLGRDDDGRDVLLDLEALGGSISLTGSSAVAREVASAVAVQLAYAPWADEQVVHGFHLDDTVSQIAGDRLVVVEDVAGLVREWSTATRNRPAQEVLSGRLRRADGEPPHHLVLGERPADQEALSGLTALLGEHDRGVGVVAADTLPGTRWEITVDDMGRMHVPLLDVDVDAVRLTSASAEAVAELFEAARTPEPAPTTGRVSVPESPRVGEDDHWSMAGVRVGVLGQVDVRTTGQLDPARVALATEMVVFLALQTAPVHRNVVGASIWPAGVGADVRDATIDRVRDWLGVDAEGNHLLRESPEGRLHLADDVAVDWHAFCALALRSRSVGVAEEAELLRRALQLVRGELLAGRPAQRYSWLARTPLERQASDVVVDVARRLVELSLPQDPGGAAAACRSGLRLAPTEQALWRDLVLSESQRPDGPGPASVVAEMQVVLRDAGAVREAETDALIEELLPHAGFAEGTA